MPDYQNFVPEDSDWWPIVTTRNLWIISINHEKTSEGIAKLYHKMALYKSIKQPKNISGMSKFAQSLNVSRKSLAAVGSATLRCLGTATPWRVLVAWSFGCGGWTCLLSCGKANNYPSPVMVGLYRFVAFGLRINSNMIIYVYFDLWRDTQ